MSAAPVRCLITGSCSWTDTEPIHGALDILVTAAYPALVVVHGCAKGADLIADGWVRDRKRHGWPVEAERHPADWKRYGRRAGMLRNSAMVVAGGDVCVTAIDPCEDPKCRRRKPHGSHGATHCAGLAAAADIRLVELGLSLEDALGLPIQTSTASKEN